MLHNRKLVRPGLTAIAAVLALSPTPLSAQEVDPAVSAPAETAAPPVSEAPSTTAADPLAPVAAETTASESAPAATPTRRATTTRRSAAQSTRSAPAAASPAASSAVVNPPAETTIPDPSASPVPPLAAETLAANPMTPDVAPAEAGSYRVDLDQALPIAGATGLALLGFAGIGLAMRRRRRRNADSEEQNLSYRDWHEWHEPAVARAEPTPAPKASHPRPQTVGAPTVAAPAMGWTTPSAFKWGTAPSTPITTPAAINESRMEAAYRGPTPDNPFLSLKKRLRRAAFFDQRDRAVRVGVATPVSPMAGLPKSFAAKTAGVVRGGNVIARPALVPA